MEGLRRLNDRDDFTHSAQAAQALEEYRLENDVERLFVNDAGGVSLNQGRKPRAPTCMMPTRHGRRGTDIPSRLARR